MIRINLLPVREARRKQDLQQQVLFLALIVGITLAGIGYVHYSIRADISDSKARAAQIEAQIKKFEPQLKQVEAFKAKKTEVEQKLAIIEGLERSRSGPVHMMDELATHTPERTWLTKIESKGPIVSLHGMSLDNEIVAVFLTALNRSPYFGNVELKSTELNVQSGLKLHKFEVAATLEDPEKNKAEQEAAGGTQAPGAAPAAAPAAPGAKPGAKRGALGR